MDIGTLTGNITLEDQLSSILARIDVALKQTGEASLHTAKGIDTLQGSMTSAATVGAFLGNTLASYAQQAVSFTTNIVKESLMAGARLEQLGGVTRFLGQNAGYSAKFIDDLAIKIEKTGITGVQSRDAIVQLLSAHIDLKRATELSAVAQNMATISGESSSETFKRIVAGITGMNTMLLRGAGFTTTLTQATDEYAKSIGKSGGALTGAEKQQALLNAVLKEGAEKAGLYGLSMEYSSKIAGSSERAWQQVSEQIGTVLLPITNVAIKSWYALGTSLRDSVAGIQTEVGPAMQHLADMLKGIIETTGQFVSMTVTGAVNVYKAYDSLPPVVKIFTQNLALLAAGLFAVQVAAESLMATKLGGWIASLAAEIFKLSVMTQAFGWGTLGEAALANLGAAFTKLYNIILAHPFVAIAAAIAGVTLAYTSWRQATAEAQLQTETAAAKQFVLNKALKDGWSSTETDQAKRYAEAIAFNNEQFRKAHGGAKDLQEAISDLSSNSGHTATQLDELERSVMATAKANNFSTPLMKQVGVAIAGVNKEALAGHPALQAVAASMANSAAGADLMSQKLKSLKDAALTPLTEAQKEYTRVAMNTESIKEILKVTGATEAATKAYITELKKSAAEQTKIEAALTNYNAKLGDYQNVMAKIGATLYEGIAFDHARGKSIAEIAAAYSVTKPIVESVVYAEKQWAEQKKIGAQLVKIQFGELKGFHSKLLEVDETELKWVRTQVEVAAGLKMVERSIPAPLQGFYNMALSLEDVGRKSTEIDELRIKLDKLAAAERRASESLATISEYFTKLGQVTGGMMGAILSGVGQVVVGLESAHKQSKQLGIDGHELGGHFGPLSTIFNDNADRMQKFAAGVQTAAGIAQGAIAVWDATSAHSSAAGNALGGMMAGAQAGSMFGPYGMAVGAAAGLVVGIIRGKPAWAKAAEEVGRDFGEKISDDLAKAIAKSAKEDFGGSRQAAAISHLSDIIKEAGGLSKDNLAQMTDRFHDVFSLIETHQMTIAQGAKVMDENFAQFAQAGTNNLGMLDKQLVEIIKLNGQYGTQSKEIAAYVSGQLTNAQTGFSAALRITGNAYADRAKQQAEFSKRRAEMDQDEYLDIAKIMDLEAKYAKADLGHKMAIQIQIDQIIAKNEAEYKGLMALHDQIENNDRIIEVTGLHSQEAASAVASSLAGIVSANMEAGKSFIESVRAIGPNVELLQAQLEATGYTGGAAFDFIKNMVDFANDEIAGPALESIEGYTAGMIGLSNAGILNQETFSGLAGQIAATEEALVAQGYSSDTVMLAMRGDLQTIWEMQQRYGYSVDESTQALIDQGVQSGLIGEQAKSDNQKILDVLMAIGDALGAKIPEGLRAMEQQTKTTAANMKTELDKIPKDFDIQIEGHYIAPDIPDYASRGGRVTASGVQYLAVGGPVLEGPWPARGSDTVATMLTPGEGIVTTKGMERLGNEGLRQLNQGGFPEMPSNEEVVDSINGLRSDLKTSLPRAMSRAIATGLVGLRTA